LARTAAYNDEDCEATLALRDWLLRLRDERGEAPPAAEPTELRVHTPEEIAAFDARRRLREALIEGAEPGSPRWLAGELLEYHRREARPGWSWYFGRLGMSVEELVEDSESIGGLEADSRIRPAPSNRSLEHTLTFPPQEHKLGPGRADDPFTRRSAGEILEIDDAKGILRLRRGPSFDTIPLPRALIAEGPYRDREQQQAVLRVAESIRDGD